MRSRPGGVWPLGALAGPKNLEALEVELEVELDVGFLVTIEPATCWIQVGLTYVDSQSRSSVSSRTKSTRPRRQAGGAAARRVTKERVARSEGLERAAGAAETARLTRSRKMPPPPSADSSRFESSCRTSRSALPPASHPTGRMEEGRDCIAAVGAARCRPAISACGFRSTASASRRAAARHDRHP